jgi:hypothetical protein
LATNAVGMYCLMDAETARLGITLFITWFRTIKNTTNHMMPKIIHIPNNCHDKHKLVWVFSFIFLNTLYMPKYL